MKQHSIFNRVTSFLLAAVLVLGVTMQKPLRAAAEETAPKLPMPTITYSGMTLDPNDSVPTTDEHLPYLIENTKNFSFNFYPDKAKMPTGDTWFEYAYDRSIDFSGLKLVGWWPTAQGIKEISIQYFDGTAWQDGDQKIALDWKTPASEGGPENLEVTFSKVITGTKLRVQILSMYQAWSTPRCCTRLLAPVGSATPMETDEARAALGEALESARQAQDAHKDEVTSAAAALLDYALATAQKVYDDANADSAALTAQKDLVNAARDAYVTFAGGRTALQEGVASAETLLAESEVGGGYGQHPESARDALVKAMDSAKNLLADQTLTDAELFTSKAAALTKQINAFRENKNDTLSKPEISVVNMSVVKGEPSYLVDRTNRDFNVDPGKALNDAYLEYNYINLVRIYEIDLAGWFPLQQGVSNLSFEYYEDGEWKLSDQNVEVPWTTPQIKDEKLTITLSAPVETTKFRIRINDAHRDWSYICMHGMEPRGVVLTDILALFEVAQDMINQSADILTGSLPGEVPAESVTAVRQLAEEIMDKLQKGEVTAENFPQEQKKMEAAWAELLKEQAPAYDDPNVPKVTAEGLTVLSGSLQNLVDKQLMLGADFDTIEDGQDAYLVLDYGDRVFELEQLTITAQDGAQKGFQQVSLEYFDGSAWKAAKERVDLKWRENASNYQGMHVKLDTPVSATKFRIKIVESAETPNVRELMAKGTFATSESALQASIARGEAVLAKGYADIDDMLDVLKLRLASAKNPDTVNRAAQEKLNELAKGVDDAVAAIENYLDAVTGEAKAMLKDIIDEADSYQLDRYVDGKAKEDFQKTLLAVKEIYNKADAAVQEIDGAKMDLLYAMDKLRLRADKSNLNDWLEELKKLDLTRYTRESADALLAVLSRAEELAQKDLGQESSGLIAQMIDELDEARKNLVLEAGGEPDGGSGEEGQESSVPEGESSTQAEASESAQPESGSNPASATPKPATGDGMTLLPIAGLAVAGAGALLLLKKRK